MNNAYGKGYRNVLLIVIILILFIGIIAMSGRLQDEVDEIVTKQEPIKAAPKAQVRPKKIIKDIFKDDHDVFGADFQMEGARRVTRVIEGTEYILHLFYKGEDKVATMKEYADGSTDLAGRIPEGKMEFIDYYKRTQGEEFYRNGKKHGQSKVFYEDGSLKLEENYIHGLLVSAKEFYSDGALRFEVDYLDAKEAKDGKEKGIGKLYFPNGRMKYEWKFVNRDNVGFQKSYNQDGTLRHEAYYDRFGKPVQK